MMIIINDSYDKNNHNNDGKGNDYNDRANNDAKLIRL